ncbi:MAG: hypothetical protein P8099_02880 [Gemmatimonadota bacterium]
MNVPGRDERMARRLEREMRRGGVTDRGISRVLDAYRLAMEPRVAALEDRHPDFLHPARTVLVLLLDAGVRDGVLLSAAALCESLRPELAVPAGRAARAAGVAVGRLLGAVPVPETSGEELLEDLVASPADVLLLAVAERLDHARHLHLAPREEWEPFHATACGAYVVAARRTDPRLAGRFAFWCRHFGERYLRDAGPRRP